MDIKQKAHERADYLADVLDITDADREMIEESLVNAMSEAWKEAILLATDDISFILGRIKDA